MSVGKRILTGIVVSDKMQKSAVVKVEAVKIHPKYLKRIKTSKKYSIHDPENLCKEGDLVEIIESRPISKTKKFALSKVLKKGVAQKAVVV